MLNMSSTFVVIIDEMYNIARECNRVDLFEKLLNEMEGKLEEY
jgi:hypothetical protein